MNEAEGSFFAFAGGRTTGRQKEDSGRKLGEGIAMKAMSSHKQPRWMKAGKDVESIREKRTTDHGGDFNPLTAWRGSAGRLRRRRNRKRDLAARKAANRSINDGLKAKGETRICRV